MRVQDLMTTHVYSCRPEDSLAQAENTMRQARIRRLPVVDDQGILVGMLALADLAREAAREQSQPRQEITEKEVGNTLAAICGERPALQA